MLTAADLRVTTLGECQVASPLKLGDSSGDDRPDFVPEQTTVRYELVVPPSGPQHEDLRFEKAGPRQRIFFDPQRTTAAIVTCGGLCPGINNVIRSMFLELVHNYGVRRVLGIRHGYRGLNPRAGDEPLLLSEDFVRDIHKLGGTVLGTSRGPQPVDVMVDFLHEQKIDILLGIGGDGTQQGLSQIVAELKRRELPVAVVGVPKTIDNDIPYVERSFGYLTAVEQSSDALHAAHTEARSVDGGIGLVKLMGRNAGFIAAAASLASQDVNFCLVPEIAFQLEGDRGLLPALERRLRDRRHALIAVAEGAGQHLLPPDPSNRDESGNVRLNDIGGFLCGRIKDYFARRDTEIHLKYIDPSYLVRSVPAGCADALLCDQFARSAVHAAMAGRTDLLVGLWHGVAVHLPIPPAVATKKRMSPEGELFTSVLLATGQPRWSATPDPE